MLFIRPILFSNASFELIPIKIELKERKFGMLGAFKQSGLKSTMKFDKLIVTEQL